MGIGRALGLAACGAAVGFGVLAACGGDDDATATTGLDGGASEAASTVVDAGPPATELSACKAYLQAYCDRLEECGGDATTICDLYGPMCPDYTFAAGSARTIQGVIACAATRRVQPCGELLAGVTPACSPPGTLDAGAPCRFVAQCASEQCSTGDGACGYCEALSTDGGACTSSCAGQKGCVTCSINDTCTGGGQCLPIVAAPELAAGAACAGSLRAGYCTSPLRCLATDKTGAAGTCKTAPALGEACTSDLVQPSRSPCATGRCAPQTNGSSLCVDGLAGPQEACRSADECQPALTCNGHCVTPKADGASCNSIDVCARTSFCSVLDNKCRPQLALGAACSQGTDVCAASGACTQSTTADGGAGPTVCTAKRGAAIGEACATSTDCARSADCNAQHVCAFAACQ